MNAPPTRAEVSRKYQAPVSARMNSVCDVPRTRPKLPSTRAFDSSSAADSKLDGGSVSVAKMPPSCATRIGGVLYRLAIANRTCRSKTIEST